LPSTSQAISKTPAPRWPTHGGELDTSLMLHLAPELVHMELAQDYLLTERQVERYRRRAAVPSPPFPPVPWGGPASRQLKRGHACIR